MSVPAARLTPSRGWFFGGALVIVAAITVGVVLIVHGALSLASAFTTEIPTGTQQPVALSRGGQWALYGAVTGYGRPRSLSGCLVSGTDGGQVTTSEPSSRTNFTRNGRQWYWVATITVSAAGEYTFTCAEGGNVDRYAVGDTPNTSGFVVQLGAGIVTIIAGLGIGAAMIIVTAVRRSSARTRMWRPPY